MNIAFYAPLKAPDHANPSGDRAVGRMLLSAMRRAGHRIHLASRLRSLDRHGDRANQQRIKRRAQRVMENLLDRYQRCALADRPQLWFTYHLYHKAPDFIGPPICRALNIPYVVAEASHAPKRAGGAWDEGHRSAAQAIKQAAMIICLNPADEACLRELIEVAAMKPPMLRRLAPFIDARASARALRELDLSSARRASLGMVSDIPIIACAAMMRNGDKLASYGALAQALITIKHMPWQLLILGDGPARDLVEARMRPFAERVFFAGLVTREELPRWLAGCDVYAWPAVNEAWSMALLEAAAVGLPAVAGDEGGVASVITNGRTGVVAAARDTAAFAQAVAALLGDNERRLKMGRAAREKIDAEHDLTSASGALNRLLSEVVG